MYGKAFESQYEGSMIGAGMNVFAVWNYAFTKARCGAVELNPKLLAFILGGTEKQVNDAIQFLSSPDPKSRSKLEEGRRLVREGEYQYRLVNYIKYNAIRNADDLREYNRQKQAEYRSREKAKLAPGPKKWPCQSEREFIKGESAGDTDAADNATRTRAI